MRDRRDDTGGAGPARRVLAVSPRYARSFGTFDHAFPLLGVAAFMPPQGLLTVAGFLPPHWPVRFVDENVRPLTDADLEWAEIVLISGMHVQRERTRAIAARAAALGRVCVLGGPSVSADPDLYPEVDLLHVGELGDATVELVARLGADPGRPARQEIYRTADRLPLADFPQPRYDLIDPADYLLASVQFSSGCPFRCEFCDIPALYGQRPRRKSVPAVLAELDALLARGNPGSVYFVDDNFIADPRAAVELLTGLVQWQRDRGYPVTFACEATMNLAKRTDILAKMREAAFTTVFMGVESPDLAGLRLMRKTQNLATPLEVAVATLNRHGLEVVAGIILGLDTDDERSGQRVLDFIATTRIPMLTINLLHALPRTPLWDRLSAAGRIVPAEAGRESNVDFLRPYDAVVADWRRTVTTAFRPEALYERFAYQLTHTYPNRLPRPARRPEARELRRGLAILARTLWHAGVRSGYRRTFWRTARPLLRRLELEHLVHIAVVAHHLSTFAAEVAAGRAEKCFYNPRPEDARPARPATPTAALGGDGAAAPTPAPVDPEIVLPEKGVAAGNPPTTTP
ncbi:B12-binding domain-containing radical SAM protein [Plantactinospora siamensis]|uniref:B12-binding domain-containing radical SAM protein n=1 Tax=Plantactinospora siamensis TaxID=555372 RepID=A0ABV6P2U1_9ACTN